MSYWHYRRLSHTHLFETETYLFISKEKFLLDFMKFLNSFTIVELYEAASWNNTLLSEQNSADSKRPVDKRSRPAKKKTKMK